MAGRRLSARGIELCRGGRRLTSGLDLDVEGGSILGVVGPSGSGKTSLLRVLALLDDPAAGLVLLDGEPPSHAPRFRRSVIYVAQQPALLGSTVRDELERPFQYASATRPFETSRAVEVLDALGLDVALDRASSELSQGERQRLCLARALLVEPAFLLLDEPTSALDAEATGRVERCLAQHCARGAGIVLVSHDGAQRARLAKGCVSL